MCVNLDGNNRFALLKITQLEHELVFEWTDIGGLYRVYRDDILVHEGLIALFTDTHVSREDSHRYAIERLEKGQTIDVIKFQTISRKVDMSNEHPLAEAFFTTIVSASGIILHWQPIQGVKSFDIFRDGKFLASVTGQQYTDYEPIREHIHTYQVQFRRPLKNASKKSSKSLSLLASLLATMKKEEKLGYERFEWVVRIAPLRKLLVPTEERDEKTKYGFPQWHLRYTTFLSERRIKNSNFLSRHASFQGDNRSFSVHAKTYRTRVDLVYDSLNQRHPLTYQRSIGATVSYNRLGSKLKKKYALKEDIKVQALQHPTERYVFRLHHDVKNPIVLAPKITYEVIGKLTANGLIEVTGFHDEAPNHEVYIKIKDEDWYPIHLTESKGLFSLINGLSRRYWRFSTFE